MEDGLFFSLITSSCKNSIRFYEFKQFLLVVLITLLVCEIVLCFLFFFMVHGCLEKGNMIALISNYANSVMYSFSINLAMHWKRKCGSDLYC